MIIAALQICDGFTAWNFAGRFLCLCKYYTRHNPKIAHSLLFAYYGRYWKFDYRAEGWFLLSRSLIPVYIIVCRHILVYISGGGRGTTFHSEYMVSYTILYANHDYVYNFIPVQSVFLGAMGAAVWYRPVMPVTGLFLLQLAVAMSIYTFLRLRHPSASCPPACAHAHRSIVNLV